MLTAEEQDKERSVFDDDDDADDDAEDSYDDDSDDDDEDAAAAGHPSPTTPQPSASKPLAAAAPQRAGLNSSAAPSPNFTPNPNPAPISNHNPSAAPSDPAGPLNGATPVVTIPIAAAPALSPEPASTSAAVVTATLEERRPLALAYDESRRLFQRLWTDDDEIKILQGFFDFTSKRGTTFASHQYDTGPFYEDIKQQLNLEFTKNQLIEKLRRLKKKYRNCVSRMRSKGKDFAFKSAHERSIYDIARNIWSANVKRVHDSDDEDLNAPINANSNEIITVPINEGSLSTGRRSTKRRRLRRRMAEEAAAAAPAAGTGTSVGGVAIENSAPASHTHLASVCGVPSIIEETVKSCLLPLFKELINSPFSSGGGGVSGALNLLPLSLGSTPLPALGAPINENWKNQQILELEVYLKRIELVRDCIKLKLEELKSSSG